MIQLKILICDFLKNNKEVFILVHKQIVKDKLINLEEFINDLDEYTNMNYEKLISDKKLYRFLERTIQLSLEVIFDIGNHIIIYDFSCEPESKNEIIEILASNKIIKENINDYIKLAKFYNTMIHDFKGTDPDDLLEIINNNYSNLKDILKWYVDYIF